MYEFQGLEKGMYYPRRSYSMPGWQGAETSAFIRVLCSAENYCHGSSGWRYHGLVILT